MVTTLFKLLLSFLLLSDYIAISMPLTEEDTILANEIEWAEQAMEQYRRKNGNVPIRSPIQAAHVHSKQWERDSIDHFYSQEATSLQDLKAIPTRNTGGSLRGGRSAQR